MDYKTIFTAPYDRDAWQQLLHDIFLSKAHFFDDLYRRSVEVNTSIATTAYHLGKIDLSDVHTLGVYEAELAESIDIAHNRRGIRDLFTAHWRGQGYVGAFVIAYRKEESSIRFSYVSETWGINAAGQYARIATDTKRFTYLLGADHSCRTAVQQFKKLKSSDKTLRDVTAAFSVEALSREFFGKYKDYYNKFVAVLSDSNAKVAAFAATSHTQGDDTHKAIRDFVKKQLGRIVFLHFLQRKGWLGVPQGKDWGQGPRDFMQQLFSAATEEQKDNFLDRVLVPLCANALDCDRGDDSLYDTGVAAYGTVRIPYLNGGLFECNATDGQAWHIPRKLFRDLFAMLSEYNFTIDENDPDDAEVGVDPEMLGRIFENLLEDNKDKGAYYTPKEIVQYMCRESLIAYLQTGLTAGEKDAVRQFVATHDAQPIANEKINIKEAIGKRLREVRICDPAIGSGAFPMGLLRELFSCRMALAAAKEEKEKKNAEAAADSAAEKKKKENAAALLKREIIQNNIYGVDIESGAVEIARLRFWLALVVDEQSPATLPNLDFKIMQGNSLLEEYHGIDLSKLTDKKNDTDPHTGVQVTIYDTELDALRLSLSNMIAAYYSCADHKARLLLRDEIKEMVRKEMAANHTKEDLSGVDIYATSAFFLWHTWFADVFAQGGFDIVIGNPPYGATYSAEERAIYKKKYLTAQTIKGQQKGSLDTFTLFIERGFTLLRKDGVLAYIVPMAITSSDSVTGVHRLLMSQCATLRLSSYAVRPQPVFENAVVDVSILQCTKTLTPCQHLFSTKMYRKGNDFNLQQLIDNLQFVDVKGLTLFGRIPKIGTEIEKSILTKLNTHKRLSEYIKDKGHTIYYRFAGGRYFKVITNYSNGSSAERTICLGTQAIANAVGCILSSSLSFWFYQIYSDNHNWKDYEIKNFPLPPLSDKDIAFLNALYARYLADIEAKANIRTASGTSTYNVATFKEYKIVRSKAIIDEIDDYICPLYGLTAEETEFIKTYELSFRLRGE